MSTSWCLRKVGPNPRFNRSNSPLLSQVFVSGGAAGGKGIELPGVTEAGSAVRPPQPPRPPPPASRVRAHGADAHGAAPLWRCNSHISSVCNVQSAAFSTVTGSPTHPVQSRASRHPRRKPRPHQQSLPTPSPAPDTHSLSSCPRGRPCPGHVTSAGSRTVWPRVRSASVQSWPVSVPPPFRGCGTPPGRVGTGHLCLHPPANISCPHTRAVVNVWEGGVWTGFSPRSA